MADYVLIFPELSVAQNAVALMLIIIIAYELTMLDLDSQPNERKHIVKVAMLFALLAAEVIAYQCFNLL